MRIWMLIIAVGLVAGCENPFKSDTTNNTTVNAEEGSTLIMNSSHITDANGTQDNSERTEGFISQEEMDKAAELERSLWR